MGSPRGILACALTVAASISNRAFPNGVRREEKKELAEGDDPAVEFVSACAGISRREFKSWDFVFMEGGMSSVMNFGAGSEKVGALLFT